jgi:DNA-3-methyladenine glycosylase
MHSFPFGRPLPRSFYDRDTNEVARELLGCMFVRTSEVATVAGIIVETEAYLCNDPASHSYGGLRQRNAVMFGPSGHIYIYLSYGINWCANTVTRSRGTGEAVLIRALEPICGLEEMAQRRGLVTPRLLSAGPGRVCQALGLTGEQNGLPIFEGDLYIAGPSPAARPIVEATRIGLTKAVDKPWRYYYSDSKCVSRRGSGTSIRRAASNT